MSGTISNQIVTSLLDVDFYKFTMLYVIWLKHRDNPIKFQFKNRTESVRILDFVKLSEIREQLEAVRELRFQECEIQWLRERGRFDEEFLQWLKTFQLSKIEISVDSKGRLSISARGPWVNVTLWETILLAVVNEMYYNATVLDKESAYLEGQKRLTSKIAKLIENPWIKFAEFGTRRRFSRKWQKIVLERLIAECPGNLLGTSNCLLAMELGIDPIGTLAHEMDMVYSGIYHDEDDAAGYFVSHDRMKQDWWTVYGYDLSIFLSDTYGSKYFFDHFSQVEAERSKGVRQDSGSVFEFGNTTIKFYEDKGIDPSKKLALYSDGLDVDKILAIGAEFLEDIILGFGWGTNLSNDLGYPSLSLVAKAVESNGYGTVKLSDNLAKATGTEEAKARAIRLSGYTNTESEVCVY